MKKKIIAVIAAVCIFVSCSAALAFATGLTDSTPGSTSSVSASYIGSILRAFLGDAADNLTNNELGNIFTSLFGDFDLSKLVGLGSGGTSDIIGELLEYLGGLETTTDEDMPTRPVPTTEAPTTAAPTTQAPTTQAPTTQPSTTAQAVQNYYYYYVDSTTAAQVGEYTLPVGQEAEATTYSYVAPETMYVEIQSGIAQDTNVVDEKSSSGTGIKTIIGLIILIGSGVAVVVLCVRKKASY